MGGLLSGEFAGMKKLGRNKTFRQLGWQILSIPFLLFILIPIVQLFFKITPESFIQQVQSHEVIQAMRLSLVTTLLTVIATIIFGTPVAYLIHHRNLRIARWTDALVDLPTVLPPAVAGLALLLAFGRAGWIGKGLTLIGIQIPFTTAAVVMAQTFIAAPYYIRSAAMGFDQVGCEIKRAAALDGASRWQVFRYIMVPMSWMAIINGCILTWARALGEFGATILFAGNFPGRTQTMPLAIYLGFEVNMQSAITLSVILIVVSLLVLVIAKRVLNEKVEIEEDNVDY
jgi:molybdate transport system permease protein